MGGGKSSEDGLKLQEAAIAVTGATGFLGRYIAVGLIGRGANVIGVVRNPSRRPELARQGVEFRVADLRDEPALVRAFRGVVAVVANAGVVPERRDPTMFETNVRGTENVLNAAHLAGVRRVVLVSSVAAYRFNRRNVAEDGQLLSEHARLIPMRRYRISKLLSERVARRLADHHSIDLTVVRPGVMYDAFGPNLPLLRRLLGGSIAVIPFGLRIPLAYGGDVAEAIVRCLANDCTVGATYNLTGPDRASQEFVQAWSDAGGHIAKIRVPVPIPLRLRYSTERAEADLEWCHTPFREALRETFATETAAQRPAEADGRGLQPPGQSSLHE